MRTAFIKELQAQARLHHDIFLVVGDLGFSVVEDFATEFPDRFLNAGIAEQNMTGVAAGLAAEGYHVFVYSIANFPTFRCLEQIRNDVAYHHLPVTVVSVGAGMAYGSLGYSHHAVQDIGIMRMLPEMTILSPADPGEARACTRYLAEHPCPSYLRIGKAGEPELHQATEGVPGLVEVVHGGADVAIVATGSILKNALEAVAILEKDDIRPSVFSMSLLHPVTSDLVAPLHTFGTIFALEEHLATGGLASILRDSLPISTTVHSLSLPDNLLGIVGSQKTLLSRAGLDGISIAERVAKLLRNAPHSSSKPV
jgi:transketolase